MKELILLLALSISTTFVSVVIADSGKAIVYNGHTHLLTIPIVDPGFKTVV